VNDQNPLGACATDTTTTLADRPIDALRVVLPAWFICSVQKKAYLSARVQRVFRSGQLYWSRSFTAVVRRQGFYSPTTETLIVILDGAVTVVTSSMMSVTLLLVTEPVELETNTE